MSGHVFVVRGNLMRFACDAWLIPTDFAGSVTKGFWGDDHEWQTSLTGVGAHGPQGPTSVSGPDWREGLTIRVPTKDIPQPWLVRVAGSIDDALKGLDAFVRVASQELPLSSDPKVPRLLAVPVVGTGAGGVADKAGALIGLLLPKLFDLASQHLVDIALVAFSDAHWAAAQVQRRSDPCKWWPVSQKPELYEEAKELGKQALVGNLVLFLGAGISCGAGLPTWSELLEGLEEKASLDETSLKELRKLGFLDRAQVLAKLLNKEADSAGHMVVKALKPFYRYGLGHALLASMPIREVITSNYDTLFESASKDAGWPTTVLPFEPSAPGSRWLLKMHGCVNHPQSIVITRENYMRYADQSEALAGIVQAMLMTRKMLFLGFSLTDDNFHRIVDAVRRAIHPDGKQGKAFGQALMVGGNTHLRNLWSNEIDWTEFDHPREVNLFLDRLCCEAAQSSYLLNHQFEDLLTPSDKALRDLLAPLTNTLGCHKESVAWPLVAGLLRKLGNDGAMKVNQ